MYVPFHPINDDLLKSFVQRFLLTSIWMLSVYHFQRHPQQGTFTNNGMRALQLILVVSLLLVSYALPVYRDDPESSPPKKKEQGSRRGNKVPQENRVSSENGKGSNQGQIGITSASMDANGRLHQVQQDVGVASETGKSYPDDFWVKNPELGIYQDGDPEYPFVEPDPEFPGFRPEEADQADEELDECWAKWLRNRRILQSSDSFSEENLQVHDRAHASLCITRVSEKFGLGRVLLKRPKFSYIPTRYEKSTKSESAFTNPSAVDVMASIRSGWEQRMKERTAAVGHMLRSAWAREKQRDSFPGTVPGGFGSIGLPHLLAVP
ncbi:MAG: hypothetical protein M1816_002624 [Peltula sp. TS41687]|nr:MAG: hypothetical protein M1816_002624 [Peltula sp. TS41687]